MRARSVRQAERIVRGGPRQTAAAIALILASVFFPFAAEPTAAAQSAVSKIDFRGQVLLPAEARRPGRRINVVLTEVGSTFSAQTFADGRGRFRFRNLRPGSYSLALQIPGTGEVVKTVNLTASFADRRGRIEKQFEFDQETLAQQARSLVTGTVSLRELSIPRNARREYERARSALRRERMEEAVRRLERAVELAPQYMEALNNLGIIHFHQQEFAEAEGYFRQALEVEPEAFEPTVNLGGALLAQDKVEEAIEVNRRAQEMRPNDALANAQLGLSYFFAGQDEDALNYLLLTEELDPAHFTNPQLSLARIYLRHSEEESALEELQDFLRHNPDSPEAPSVRAMVERLQAAVEADGLSAAD